MRHVILIAKCARNSSRAFSLLLTLCLSIGLAQQSGKRSPDLINRNAADTLDVIVQFNGGADDVKIRNVNAAGGLFKKRLDPAKAALFTMKASDTAKLDNDPNVRYISPDRPVRGALDYAVAAVNANIAQQYGWDGAGVVVAVIDSGITSTTDLNGGKTSRVIYSQSFVPGSTATSDVFGHGDHVAGIIAGNGTSSSGSSYTRTFKGVAPNAQIVNLRVLDGNGTSSDSAVIAAIQRAVELKQTGQYNIG